MMADSVETVRKSVFVIVVQVAIFARVPTAAVFTPIPIIHVPDVGVVAEMLQERVYEPRHSSRAVFTPLAHASDEDWLLRVRRGAPHELKQCLETLDHERSAVC